MRRNVAAERKRLKETLEKKSKKTGGKAGGGAQGEKEKEPEWNKDCNLRQKGQREGTGPNRTGNGVGQSVTNHRENPTVGQREGRLES